MHCLLILSSKGETLCARYDSFHTILVAGKHVKLHFVSADFLRNIPIHLFVNANKTASL